MLNKNQDQTFGDGGIGVQAGRDVNVQIGFTQDELNQSIQTTVKLLQDSHREQIENLKEDKSKLEQQLTEAIRALTYKSKDINESDEVRHKFERALNLIKVGNTLEAERLFLEIENNELKNIEKSTQKAIEAALNRGALAYMRDTKAAISAYERVLQLEPNNFIANSKLAYLFMRTSELDKSEKLFKQILNDAEDQKNPEWVAASYSALGQTYFCMGRYDDSIANQKKAINIREFVGDIAGCISSYIELANSSLGIGEFPEAKKYIKNAEALIDDASNDELVSTLNSTKGIIYSTLNELNVAKPAFIKALEYSKKADNLDLTASAYGNLGILYKNTGDFKEAEEMFRSSIDIERSLSRSSGLAADLVNQANLYNQMGKLGLALKNCRESLEISKNINSKRGIIAAHSSLAEIYLNNNKLEAAKDNFTIVQELEKNIGNPHGEARALVQLSNVLITLKEKRKAIANLKKAKRMLKNSGDIQLQNLVKQLIKKLT